MQGCLKKENQGHKYSIAACFAADAGGCCKEWADAIGLPEIFSLRRSGVSGSLGYAAKPV
jgi:hypothetical protein